MRSTWLEKHLVAQYAAGVEECAPLSPEDERRLGSRVRAGDAGAVDLLVRANLRLVVRIVEGFRVATQPRSMLIEAGNIGLARAAHRFDGSGGIGFASFAGPWIRAAMRDAIDERAGRRSRDEPPSPP